MRELAVLAFVTLDGVMQAPGTADEDRSGGFAYGGWATPYWEGTMAHVLGTAMAEPYDILLGRTTYDLFVSHWPTAPASPASERLNGGTKYVVTGTPLTTDWPTSHAVTGDLQGAIAQLKASDGPPLQVHGSARLVQALVTHGLVDEFRIWTFPVLVGQGKRLFDGAGAGQAMTCVGARALDNGVVSQVLRPAA
ncbi:MAG: dihydrofolate reductase family protein [Tateyamaria sp.]